MKKSNSDAREIKLQLSNLNIDYDIDGGNLEVIRNLNLEVYNQEFLSIVGVSGCGKSTLLNVIAGFFPHSSGDILLNGKPVTGPGSDRTMVFQEDAVFPWYTVRQNIEYGLKVENLPPTTIDERVNKFLKLIDQVDFQDRYPRELSGGMRKRVDVARAMITEPEVILMDEPFASLDVMTKEKMQVDLLEIWNALRMTVVFVTHDLEEALFLSDRIAVMSTKPGSVKHVIDVPFPRPREPKIKTENDFQDIRRELAEELHRI